jgi:hypothetical protein
MTRRNTKNSFEKFASCAFVFFVSSWLFSAVVSAQWLHLPTPGIPRTADGKPDLNARAPRTRDGRSDLSGIWHRSADRFYNNVAADLKPGDVQPWADALYQQRRHEYGKDSMESRCLPSGPAAATTPYADVKIVQTPSLVVILLNDLTYREVHMDGRQLPKDPNPTWMGYSVGRWDGDTLVVESTGFTDRSWLDYDGHPHTERLRMTERYRRRDFGHLDLSVTFDDPGAFTKPWTVSVPLDLFPDTEMLEAVCRENEKDHVRMPAQPAGATPVIAVPRDTLIRYVGEYEFKKGGKTTLAVIAMSGNGLSIDVDRTGPQQLEVMSPTHFSYSGTEIHFVADSQNAIAHFLMRSVEGDDRFDRTK